VRDIFTHFHFVVVGEIDALVKAGELPDGLDLTRVAVEPPRDPAHGDLSTNAAMILAKPAKMPPRDLAQKLAVRLAKEGDITAADVAGPGFINLKIADAFWQARLIEILEAHTSYGDSDLGQGRRVNIEYVSANPTGPMHAGHVRGAVLGDALANLLEKAGYEVTREYYFNDAGAQVDVLARTAQLRYREALGETIGEIPEGLYPGEYMKDVGAALVQRDGRKWLDQPESAWLVPIRDFAVQYMMREIRSDLDLIGIKHSVFTNERELIQNGTLDQAFDILDKKGLIYTGTLPPPKGKTMDDWEPAELTLFRSSQFGDSTDRPLKKRDGGWAYIMPDIAYHFDKVRRGFRLMINVLGTDHGGYLERMRPAIAALSDGEVQLEVIFNNIVKVFRNGEPVKLSKRSGNLVTLREMVEQVGAGAVRFMMLTRDPKSPLDFDFAKVIEQSKDNPVFYVQYAHARVSSVLRHARDEFTSHELAPAQLAKAELSMLTDRDEIALIRLLTQWPSLVEGAAESHEPHRIAFYLQEVAAAFHGLWNKGNADATLRFIQSDAKPLTLARLALIQAVAFVVASGLGVMGVTPLEELRG
jgi:arginyl-tRNA synthetase